MYIRHIASFIILSDCGTLHTAIKMRSIVRKDGRVHASENYNISIYRSYTCIHLRLDFILKYMRMAYKVIFIQFTYFKELLSN